MVLDDLDHRLSHLSSNAQAPACTGSLIRPCFGNSETFSLIFLPKEREITGFRREGEEIKCKAL